MGRRTSALAAVGVALCSLASPALGAPGDLDPRFADDGKQLVDFGGRFDVARDLAVYPDGSAIVAGFAGTSAASGRDLALARLTADGGVDRRFSHDGQVTYDLGAEEEGIAVAAAGDGGAYVVSSRGPAIGHALTVLRVRRDGTLDEDFGSGGMAAAPITGTEGVARELAIDPAGRIVVVGHATAGGDRDIAIARFDPDGSLDTGFGVGGVMRADGGGDEGADAVNVDAGSRITIGGTWVPSGADDAFDTDRFGFVARYGPSGTPDPAFGEDGYAMLAGAAPRGVSELVRAGGGVVAAGRRPYHFDFLFASYDQAFVQTLGPDGTRDRELSRNLQGVIVDGLSARSDGTVTLAITPSFCARFGGCVEPDFYLARFGPEGEEDSAFGEDGWRRTDFDGRADSVAGLETLADGRLQVAGSSKAGQGSDFALARYVVAPGPRDADADGISPPADRCDGGFAPNDSQGCPHAPRRLTIRRAPTGYKGEIRTPDRECLRGFKIGVFRVRGGRDQFLGYAYSNKHGDYSFRTGHRKGRFYAVTSDATVATRLCTGARSRTIAFRGHRR